MSGNPAEGVVFKPVPATWAQLRKITVRVDATPNGKNALVEAWWDEHYVKHWHFDNGEGPDEIDRDDKLGSVHKTKRAPIFKTSAEGGSESSACARCGARTDDEGRSRSE